MELESSSRHATHPLLSGLFCAALRDQAAGGTPAHLPVYHWKPHAVTTVRVAKRTGTGADTMAIAQDLKGKNHVC